MIRASALVLRGLKHVAVICAQRELWSVVLPAGYLVVDRFHLGVDSDFDGFENGGYLVVVALAGIFLFNSKSVADIECFVLVLELVDAPVE